MRNIFRLLLLCTVLMALSRCKKADETGLKTESSIPVKVLAVTYSIQDATDSYVGTVEESQAVPLSFLTTGTADKVLVDEGQRVKKGQMLATLNNFSYRNAYDIADAKEKQAQDAYNRLSAVYKNGSLPEVKMVEIETALQQARSTVMLAKKNLEDCSMYSPISGVVGRRTIEPGMNVIPGSAVLTIVQIDKVFVKIPVPENEIDAIKIGQVSTVKVAALNNEVFAGKIEQKGVMANPLSHTYEVKIAILNRNDQLRPGMVCDVVIARNAKTNAVFIPQQAIQADNKENKFVYVVDTVKNIARRKNVCPGNLPGNGTIEITSGLEQGDRVITEGYQKISENSSVNIIR
jgi:membrane fusion protein, multidrug efflux system